MMYTYDVFRFDLYTYKQSIEVDFYHRIKLTPIIGDSTLARSSFRDEDKTLEFPIFREKDSIFQYDNRSRSKTSQNLQFPESSEAQAPPPVTHTR